MSKISKAKILLNQMEDNTQHVLKGAKMYRLPTYPGDDKDDKDDSNKELNVNMTDRTIKRT